MGNPQSSIKSSSKQPTKHPRRIGPPPASEETPPVVPITIKKKEHESIAIPNEAPHELPLTRHRQYTLGPLVLKEMISALSLTKALLWYPNRSSNKRPQPIPKGLLPPNQMDIMATSGQYAPGLGLLAIIGDGGRCSHGVGYLIDQGLVLTCAHLLTSNGLPPAEVYFIKLSSGDRGYWFAAKEWRQLNNPEWDLGLILLTDRSANGKCGQSRFLPKILRDQLTATTGLVFMQPQSRNELAIFEIPTKRLKTHKAISDGSPLFEGADNERSLVGVYNGITNTPVYFSEASLKALVQASVSRPFTEVTVKQSLLPTELTSLTGNILIELPKISNIRRLILDKLKVGDAGAMTLSKGPWTDLNKLSLNGCNIGDEGLLALTKAYWPHLTEFDIRSNTLTSDSMTFLCRTKWPFMQYLSVGMTIFDSRTPLRHFRELAVVGPLELAKY